ncbi:Uma2 family endonuclease [Gloeocapsopsis crepidinum LEGE 06123]|uniref:Uma2 family endonuclease n=1 Tax=Gloeocapsopsis crepidinum LEGE 06123 TaxID=588587 RepID=A0ABR9ULN5_9CHRO|nr:Uma2 family endonuclease [Gloeocapsopsis crepidinum]MBE9188930.1 Uma2 family endonuclease [Gloeocapsopsis crepidinum LEGE 06123]
MATQLEQTKALQPVVSWEALPDDFQLEDEPVENTGQPIIAGALRESLEISGFIQPQMLIASNFGLCATINGQFVVKAPDWVYVGRVNQALGDRKSYTPNLEGDVPQVVMEFLSDTDGQEYSVKRTHPPGKWFFYEQILQVPVYVIFDPSDGLLEFYQLENGRYELKQPDENGRHWIESMKMFLGTWQGTKEARTGYWLRWWDQSGHLLPWAVELIDGERQRAEQERQRAEQERQHKERLIAFLRSQGIDPNDLPTE